MMESIWRKFEAMLFWDVLTGNANNLLLKLNLMKNESFINMVNVYFDFFKNCFCLKLRLYLELSLSNFIIWYNLIY